MRREFGGCAGNIAYTLKLLGGEPLIMATVGRRLPAVRRPARRSSGIAQQHIRRIPGTFTAQAFITTDLDDNQITAFHPGAMNHSHENHVRDAAGVTLGIVAPDGRDGMLQHAREFHAAGIPFVFDPGQGLPMFNGAELLRIRRAWPSYVTVNDYEAQMLQERTGKKLEELRATVKALVVTLGARVRMIHAGGQAIEIPCVKAARPWSIRPAAATPIARDCSTASPPGSTGRSPAGSLRCWARSRSRSAAARTIASRATEIAQRYQESFGD